MKILRQLPVVVLALGVAAGPGLAQKPQGKPGSSGAAQAQDRGNAGNARAQQNRGQGSAKAQQPGRGNQGGAKAQQPGRGNQGNAKAAPAANRGNAGVAKARRPLSRGDVRASRERLPQSFREVSRSSRTLERFVTGAAAFALARGLAPDALRLQRDDERLVVRNRADDVLFDMDRDRADRLGSWSLERLGDQEPRSGAPAFCRNGEGHPVWGREWCLDKGFGLGRSNDRYWARTRVDDIVFGRPIDRDRLDRGSLIDVLGDVVFGRLALHALTLGFDQPLMGYYVSEPQSPQILRLHSGDEPVAEMIDVDRDGRVDLLYVSHY